MRWGHPARADHEHERCEQCRGMHAQRAELLPALHAIDASREQGRADGDEGQQRDPHPQTQTRHVAARRRQCCVYGQPEHTRG